MSVSAGAATGSARPPADGAALRQLRASAQALLDEGKVDETCDRVFAALQAALVKTRELEWLLAKLRRERIGRHSERLNPGQFALLFDALLGQGGEPPACDLAQDAQEDAALDREIERAEHAPPEGDRPTRPARRSGAGWQTRGVERQVHEMPQLRLVADGRVVGFRFVVNCLGHLESLSWLERYQKPRRGYPARMFKTAGRWVYRSACSSSRRLQSQSRQPADPEAGRNPMLSARSRTRVSGRLDRHP